MQGYEPNAYDLQGDLRRNTELLTSPPFLCQARVPRTPSTMTPHSTICCVKLTEYMSITLNRRLVCQSVVVVSVDRNLLEKELGDLLSQVVRMHKLELATDKKERILAECQAEINRHEFQADYDRSLRKLGTSLRSSRRTSTTRSTTSSCDNGAHQK